MIIKDREKEDSNWGEDSIGTRVGNEWKKFKKMSAKEKFQYYCSYYLLKTILLLMAVSAVVWIIYTIANKKDPYIAGAFFNVSIEEDSREYLMAGLDEYISKSEKIKKSASCLGVYQARIDDSSDYNNIMIFDTMIRSASFDYLICNEESLEWLNDEKYQACMDVRDALDEKLISDLNPEMYTVKNSDGTEKPIAIKLEGIELLTKYNADPKTCYLVFVPNGKNKNYYGKLVEYLLK